MEKVNEVSGEGNSLDFGARIYDSRLGRWMSLDLKASKYPNLTPFHFAANSPIIFVDQDGKDIWLPYINEDQWRAFKSIIETRFDGAVSVTYEEVSFTRERIEGRKKVKYTEIKYHVQMTFNDQFIVEKIKNENPNATADVVANKIVEYKKQIESSYTYNYLNTIINTKDNGVVTILLDNGAGPIDDYKSHSINASSIANAGEYKFSLLFHAIVEQANRANKFKVVGLKEGYPSEHWDACVKQAQDIGADMVITNVFPNVADGGKDYEYDVYKAIKQKGKIVEYSKTTYSFSSDKTKITSQIKKGETKKVSVPAFKKLLDAEKKSLNSSKTD